MGTRSWEAGAQGGRPGAGAAGTGEVPHVAFSCSSVTYLGEGQTQEGIQEVNGTGTQEVALPTGKGRVRGGHTEQSRLVEPGKARVLSAGCPHARAEGLPSWSHQELKEDPEAPGKRGNHFQAPRRQLPFSLTAADRPCCPPNPGLRGNRRRP